MKNHILLAILAVLIATSHTMAYNDEVNQEQASMASYSDPDEGFTDSDVGCTDDCLEVSETVDPVSIEYIDPDTEHPYTLYA